MYDWREKAACDDQDPDLFFPVAGEHTPVGRAQYAQAQAVCARCPVRRDCQDYALDERLDSGMFGGLTPSERRELIRRRNAAMVSA